jgi:thioredoxin-related protein
MDLMKEWNIRGVPTIKVFKEGDEVFSKPGIMSVDQVLSLVN